jgi:glycosyltransferase involved in cell wall biosynthesis
LRTEEKIRILWFNWRDIKNPEAGGAEVLTHEIAKRLVSKGNYNITLFTAFFPGATPDENIDGVNIKREGGKYTVYRRARKFYARTKDDYDMIIDEINVKPFLTPKYVREKPILALIHQIAPEQFLMELPFPLSYLGYYYEKKWLLNYRDIQTITVSNSTKLELEKLGFNRITVIPQGLGVKPLSTSSKKETNPTIVFIGRLKKHKHPDHAIIAFSLVKKQLPGAKLWIIGDGYMRKELEENFDTQSVNFYGYVDSQLKYELLRRAHVFVFPATREGWPLAVLESNAMGTPVVGYDVPGLRDSVLNGETGILVKENSPALLATCLVSLLRDQTLLTALTSNALSFSKQFNWDRSCDMFDKIISDHASRNV